jgi:hypothetical protein
MPWPCVTLRICALYYNAHGVNYECMQPRKPVSRRHIYLIFQIYPYYLLDDVDAALTESSTLALLDILCLMLPPWHAYSYTRPRGIKGLLFAMMNGNGNVYPRSNNTLFANSMKIIAFMTVIGESTYVVARFMAIAQFKNTYSMAANTAQLLGEFSLFLGYRCFENRFCKHGTTILY